MTRAPLPPTGTDIGLVLPTGPGPAVGWPDAGRWFADLEASGCRAVWFTDHLFFSRDTPEALTMAAVAAASTRSCLIGTGVLQLPLRQPAAVAKAAATVAAVSAGRFVLGVGIGEHEAEYRRAGASYAGRGRALDRALDELAGLWAPDDDWFAQRPRPAHLPVWVGGRAPATLARTAARGDGWFPMFISPEGFARRNAELDQRLADAHRDPASVARAMLVVVGATEPGWSAEDARAWAGSLFRAPAGALDHHVVAGSAEQCARRLREYLDAGVGHLAVLPASEDPRRMYDALRSALGDPGVPASSRPGEPDTVIPS